MMDNKKSYMRLSIITVTYNNYEGLKNTIASIAQQTSKEFEYIVVDGASSDNTLNLIKNNANVITKWISEPDSGIYNAMNKGVRMASGDYCLFMNAGDMLFSPTTVEEIYKENLNVDFIEGRISFNTTGKLSNPIPNRTLFNYLYGINNNHQASLISRKLLLEIPYDESYKIAADMKFNIEAIICNNCSFKTIGTIICNYEVGGRSATVKHKNEVDRIYKELFPERVLIDYDNLRYHRFWPASILWNLTYKVAHIVWPYKLKIMIKKLLGKGVSEYDKNRIEEMKTWKLKN